MAVLVHHKFSRTVADYNAALHGTSVGVTFPVSRMQPEADVVPVEQTPTVYEAYFDGVSAKATSGLQLIANTKVLMVCWYRPGQGSGIILGQHDGVSSGLAIEQVSTGALFNHQVRAKLNGLTSTAIDVDTSKFYCLIVSYDAGTLDFYVGHRYDSLASPVVSLSATVTWPATAITFGDYAVGGAPCNCTIVDFVARDDALLTADNAEVLTKSFPVPTDLTVVPHDSIEDFSVDYVTLSTIGTEKRTTPANSTITWNATELAIDIDGTPGGNLQGHFVFDGLYAATDRWTWELELKIRSDPANRDHIGLGYSMAAAAYPMYRLYELDHAGFYGASRFTNGSATSSNPTVTKHGSGNLNLLNNETRRLRITYDGSAGSPAPCLCYLDGVLVASFEQTLDTYLTIPCLHYYNAAVQVNSSKYWADAVVPPFAALASPPWIGQSMPPSIRNTGYGFNRKAPEHHITEGWSFALAAAAGKEPIHPKALVQDGYNQVYWPDEIPLGPHRYRSDIMAADMVHGPAGVKGKTTGQAPENAKRGKIEGVVRDSGTLPISRRVRLLSRGTAEVVREMWSGQDGVYLFIDLDMDERYTLVAHDYTETDNAVIADNVSPELMPWVVA